MKPPIRFVRLLVSGALLSSALFLINASLKTNSTSHPAVSTARTGNLESYGRLPLLFEANRGQTDAQVKFFARGNGYALFLTPTESIFALSKENRRATLKMQLAGANPQAQLMAEDESSTKVNYFAGQDPSRWQTDIPTSTRVRSSGVYPGIDLIYYGNQRQLEFDLVVAPLADVGQISLAFTGAEKVEIDDATGDLLLHSALGTIRQQQPNIYQEANGQRQKVAGRYVMQSANHVGFAVASYDTNRPLVIDPTLVYSTFVGGTNPGQGDVIGGDSVNAIAVDAAGNAYITGRTMSMDFPTTTGAYSTAFGTGDRISYVTKINPAGTALVYSTFIPATSNAIAVDGGGNVYLTGGASAGFPATAGAYQTTAAGTLGNAFVLKLNPAGSGLVFATFVGGSGNPGFDGFTGGDVASGITVDASGSSYIIGSTYSHDYPVTPGAFQPTNRAHNAVNPKTAFVTKLNPAGSALVYSSYLGGTELENGSGIALDSTGNTYVTGDTASSDFPVTAGAFRTTYPGFRAAFMTKINTTGAALVYSTYMGGTAFGGTTGKAIAVDTAGNAYITGQTFSTNYPTTGGAFRSTYCGGFSDTFATKLNATGSAVVYSTYLCAPDLVGTPGSDNTDYGFGIAVDSSGSAIVTGFTNSSVFPVTADAQQPMRGGKDDAFLTKLNPSGSALVYSTFLGSTEFDDAFGGVALDAAGNAYIAGATASSTFPTTPGAYQTTYAGGNDVFVAKFNFSVPSTAGRLLNLSTRMQVLTGDNVLIGGFILTGTAPREVVIRAVGPSMSVNAVPVAGTLQDPTLSLRDASGAEIEQNDDWGSAPEPERTEIQFSGLKPSDFRESAILRTLNPGAYTAIVSGKNGNTGIAMVEIYDRDPATAVQAAPDGAVAPSRLSNISGRGYCSTANNIMIGGAIVGGSTGGSARVLVRGIGPSLAVNGTPVAGRMSDPQLELFNANGMSIASNDNWRSTQEQEIQATGLAPASDAEAAIVANFPPGGTTVQLRGSNNSSGIALIEIYELPQSGARSSP